MDLNRQNINNLFDLWRVAGEESNAYLGDDEFDIVEVSDSQWPNRLWFRKEVTEQVLSKAKQYLMSTNTLLFIPDWSVNPSSSSLFEKFGFQTLFEQTAMVKKLSTEYTAAKSLKMTKVSDEESAKLWQKLFAMAFGYEIHWQVILKSSHRITYYLAQYQDEPVGTGILHFSPNESVGIHSMGIIPEMRRKGLAEEMMKHLLNLSLSAGADQAFLQASQMGLGLYEKLGFESQFQMKTYGL